jgi:hypothetical protein
MKLSPAMEKIVRDAIKRLGSDSCNCSICKTTIVEIREVAVSAAAPISGRVQ